MNEKLKGKLDEAFDEGRLAASEAALREMVEADPEAKLYLQRLLAIDAGLSQPQADEAPAMFRAEVMSRLPRSRPARIKKAAFLRDLVLPLYVAVVLVASFVFRDALGITALLDTVSEGMASTSGGSGWVEILFMIASSAGILLSAWLIVTSFFGIRSRRITR